MIQECWNQINRLDFIPHHSKHHGHLDKPVQIGENQTTSQPSLISKMIQLLLSKYTSSTPPRQVLDIGSGSGIVSVLFACVLGKQSHVLGIDNLKKLVEQSKQNVKPYKNKPGFGKVTMKTMDVYQLFTLKPHHHHSKALPDFPECLLPL